ncbi:MAG: DUF4402 domain-containing protein [Gammaproteobacteria bacterium]|nr:DUF4402 domain-containing protein [Gammaproteobacteria bacterium]
MGKLRLSGHVRMPRIAVGMMVLVFPAGVLAANHHTVPVQVTFVDPITITLGNALQYGSLDENLASSESVTVAPNGLVTDPTDRVEGGAQTAASLTVTATPGKAITILVDSVAPGAGYSLADFRCNYNAGTDTACDGAGYSQITAASGTLFVGATLTGDGTAATGAANGSFDVTVTYQ